MDVSSQEICCYRYTVAGGVERELGRCTLCSFLFFVPSQPYSEAPSWWGRPPDPPSFPNSLPSTAAYPIPGPIFQVNEINFENMSNDDAVRVLREIVHKPGYGWAEALWRRCQAFLAIRQGAWSRLHTSCLTRDTLAFRPITLTVAKCWDPSPRGCFTLPRSKWMGNLGLKLLSGIHKPCLSCLLCSPEPSHLPCWAQHWAEWAAPNSSSSLQASPSGPLTLRPGSPTLQP